MNIGISYRIPTTLRFKISELFFSSDFMEDCLKFPAFKLIIISQIMLNKVNKEENPADRAKKIPCEWSFRRGLTILNNVKNYSNLG